MKSIFKKIALVLVLAMVVTMLPAKSVSVSAADASANKWTRKTCTLYIDNPVEGDKDGIYVSAAYATAAPKVTDPEGWKTEGYSVAFTSADETVATVGAKYGLVEAVGIGQTTITATYSKEGAEDVVESFPVTVKRAAASVALDEESAKAVQELVVGADPVELKAVMTDAAGNVEVVEKTSDNGGKLSELLSEGRQFVTDYLKYDVKNPEDKEVLKVEGNKLSAVAEGEATLVVKAYRYDWQSWGKTKSKYVKVVTAQAEVPVTVKKVVPLVMNATVKSVTKLELNVTGVTEENVKDIKITNQYDAPLNVLFKEPVLSEDGTTITLERYTEMTNGEILRFSFGEEAPYELVVEIGALDHIVIEGPATAVVGVETQIIVKFLDAAGVELSAPTTGVNTILEDNTYAYLNVEERKVTIYETGKTAKVQVIYDTGKFNDDWTPIEMKSNEFTITCVATPELAASAILFKLDGENVDYSNNAVTIYMNSANPKLLAQVTLNDNAKPVSGTPVSGFTFETLNPAVLLVNPDTGDLTPVSVGTASVLVKYEAGTARITGVVTVVVRANSELRSVSPDKTSATVSNAAAVGETVTFTFTGHDQYNQDKTDISGANLTSIRAPKKDNSNDLDTLGWTQDGNKITFDPVGHKEGTYTYRVAYGDISTVITIVVRKPVTDNLAEAASYRIVPVNGNVTVDLANFDGVANYTFKIVAQDKTGVAFGVVGDLASGNNNSLVVKFGNDEYANLKGASPESGVYTVSFIKTVTGSAVTTGSAITASDVPSGKNVVANGNVYEIKEGDFVVSGVYNNRTIVPVTGNVSIKKAAPTITIRNTEIVADNSDEAVKDAIINELNANDGKYTILDVKIANRTVGFGRQYVLLESVRVAEKIEDGKFVIHTVGLNRYFSVTVGQ